MKDDKLTPIVTLFISTFASVFCLLTTEFGKNVGNSPGGEAGIMSLIFIVIMTAITKEYRKIFWNKKGLLILLLAFLINLPFAIISLKNEYGF